MSKNLTIRTRLHQFFKNQDYIASILTNHGQIETKKNWRSNLTFLDENSDQMSN